MGYREEFYIADRFDEVDRGYKEDRGRHLTDWGFLAEGKQLGKRVVANFVAANSASQAQIPNVDMINIQGDDEKAHQVMVSLCAPEIINQTAIQDLQRMTGEQDNIALAKTLNNVGGPVAAGALDDAFANPIAILQWGIGGVDCRAEVDFANGQIINISTSFLRLSGMIESPGLTVTSFPYVLKAFVGPGSPGRGNNATRTVPVGAVANGAMSGVFTVPRFAKSVVVTASDGSAAPPLVSGTISFWRSPGGSADAFGVGDFFFAGNSPLLIPVPNGAYYFSVLGGYAASGGGFVTPRYSAIFQLAI